MTETLYRGIPVEELSRDELIAALKDVGRLYEEHIKADIAHLNGLRSDGVKIIREPYAPSLFALAKDALGISRIN